MTDIVVNFAIFARYGADFREMPVNA